MPSFTSLRSRFRPQKLKNHRKGKKEKHRGAQQTIIVVHMQAEHGIDGSSKDKEQTQREPALNGTNCFLVCLWLALKYPNNRQ